MDRVTIIVPIYNLEGVIGRCIESILRQTYYDIEVLLINDGSIDDSVKICQQFVNRDKRLKLISHDNKGVSYSRNKGIEHSTGKYIMFVDGDDEILPDMIEQYIYAIKSADADIVVGGMNWVEESGKRTEKKANGGIFNAKDFWTYVCTDREGLFGYVCSKMYCADILKKSNIRFDESMSAQEDLDFALSVYAILSRFCCIEYSGYIYYYAQGKRSLSTAALIKNQIKMFKLASISQAQTSAVIKRIQLQIYVGLYNSKSMSDIQSLADIPDIEKFLDAVYSDNIEQKWIIRRFKKGDFKFIYVFFTLRRFIKNIIVKRS